MKVLVIKTSSMGDIIHTLPAITDAFRANPKIEFAWIVEEAFTDIPKWHPAVKNVIPVALRRLRKKKLALLFNKEWRQFKKHLKQQHYDLIIDAQGLLKSAFLTRYASGKRCGFDKDSARESLASLFYQQKISVSKDLHATLRIRQLFAKALNYHFDAKQIDYGLKAENIPAAPSLNLPYYIFIINTTWPSKHWPTEYWQNLVAQLGASNIVIPGGYAHEAEKLKSLFGDYANVNVLEKASLNDLVPVLAHAKAIVSVDTGLSHLAAALATPTITLYGPTNPQKIGTTGNHQVHLRVDFPCAPCEQKLCSFQKPSAVKPACFSTLGPDKVLQALERLISHD